MGGSNGGMDLRQSLLVVGASGFVGSALTRALPAGYCVGTFCTRPIPQAVRFDITRERLGDRFLLRGHHFKHAVLAQGVTKLDQCAAAPQRSAKTNVLGTMQAIDDLLNAGVHPIIFSSDAVFDGSVGPRCEAEPTCPTLSYGQQKVAVEQYLQGKTGSWTILRLAKVVAGFAHERNLLSEWLTKVSRKELILCAKDQILTPIDVNDVARVVSFFLKSGSTGLYHVAGSEIVSRYQLLMELLAQLRSDLQRRAVVEACSLREIAAPEPLPMNCALDNAKLRRFTGFEFRSLASICSELCMTAWSQAIGSRAREDTAQQAPVLELRAGELL
jgi:dTDP-4-dehydrorhamnose reductase